MLLPADRASGPRAGAVRAAIAALASPRRKVSGSVTSTPAGSAASTSRIAGSSSYLDHGERGRTPRLLAGRGGDGEERLADELDELGRRATARRGDASG